MKDKLKICVIMLIAGSFLVFGTSVAYYNTKSLGFDENTKIISKDDEKISVMDFEFYYRDINDFFSKAKKYMPPDPRKVSLEYPIM